MEDVGLRGTDTDGVFFTEDPLPVGVIPLGAVTVRKRRQNWDLRRVKSEMAKQAQALGANAVVEFTYGQSSAKWWEHLLPRWDSESWYGDGTAVRL